MSLAENMAQLICENGLTARTLREWIEVTDAGNDIDALQKSVCSTILTAIQNRVDYDDNWLVFAEIPDDSKYPEEVVALIYKKAAAGYARGYVEGFIDREHLFANLKSRMPEKLDD